MEGLDVGIAKDDADVDFPILSSGRVCNPVLMSSLLAEDCAAYRLLARSGIGTKGRLMGCL